VRHRCTSKRSPGALERTPMIPLSSAETLPLPPLPLLLLLMMMMMM
jgi:hypothetical protein